MVKGEYNMCRLDDTYQFVLYCSVRKGNAIILKIKFITNIIVIIVIVLWTYL